VTVTDVNGDDAVAHARAAAPDVLVYAGAGILRMPILSVARLGVLNAHMGLLPEYKGMNALEWSLLHGHPLGVTVHFIDAGIDTGAVLLTRSVEPRRGDTISDLRRRAIRESVEGICAAMDGLRDGTLQAQPQQEGGRQFFVMHERLRALAESRLGGLPADRGTLST
jgi:methionyl-tRNA formyltransferase